MRSTPCESWPRKLAQTRTFAHSAARARSTPAACRIAVAKSRSSAAEMRIDVALIPNLPCGCSEGSRIQREEAIEPALDQLARRLALPGEREVRFSGD